MNSLIEKYVVVCTVLIISTTYTMEYNNEKNKIKRNNSSPNLSQSQSDKLSGKNKHGDGPSVFQRLKRSFSAKNIVTQKNNPLIECLLTQAAKTLSQQDIKAFVDAGGNINTLLPTGNTLLTQATRKADLEAISILLQHGANPQTAKWRSEKGLIASFIAQVLYRHSTQCTSETCQSSDHQLLDFLIRHFFFQPQKKTEENVSLTTQKQQFDMLMHKIKLPEKEEKILRLQMAKTLLCQSSLLPIALITFRKDSLPNLIKQGK